jgi:hypothetical protein
MPAQGAPRAPSPRRLPEDPRDLRVGTDASTACTRPERLHPRDHLQRASAQGVAERVSYRDPQGFLFLPGAAFARLLREAGASHKQRGSRRSLKHIMPAAVTVAEDAVPLFDAARSARDVALMGKAATVNWQAAAWHLERKMPHKWGRHERHDITGANSGAIEMHSLDDITAAMKAAGSNATCAPEPERPELPERKTDGSNS